jgi:malate/lactate dehydrogenase
VNDFAMGVPIILGENGVEKIIELFISDENKQNFKESYDYSVKLDSES